MKILITHFYSRENRGDAAILSVLVSEIKRVFKDQQIIISTIENISKNSNFYGVPTVTSFTSLTFKKSNKLFYYFYLLYILIIPIIWAIIYRISKIDISIITCHRLKQLMKTISDANLIVPVGGGYLRAKDSLHDNITVIFLLQPIIISIILGKPVILYSQSIGPFGNLFQKKIVALVLNKTKKIIVRENISKKLLKSIGVNANLIYKAPDAAFLFNTKEKLNRNKLGIPPNKKSKVLGITVREWLDNKAQQIYEDEIAKFIDYVSAKFGIIVIIIPQVTSEMYLDDDRIVGKRIYESLKYKKNVKVIQEKYSHIKLKAIYKEIDYLVGTRFHSVIFSLTEYKPSIAIEYEHKTRGIMKDLKLEDWVIKIEEIKAENLIQKFKLLTENQDKYIMVLKNNLPKYINDAKKSADILKKIYNNY